MNTNELIARVKSVIAEWHERTLPGTRATLRDFGDAIRRLEDGIDRFEAGGPTPKRTAYSAEKGTRDDLVERHESFGLVGFSRVQGSARLFGSHLDRHQHYVMMRVYRAQVVHSSLGYDHHSNGRVPIVEVAMSAAQFAEAITTMNVGDGVPCTITAVEGCPMERVPDAVVAENVKIREGFAEKIAGTVERVEAARRDFAEIVESGAVISKRRAHDLLSVLDRIVMDISSNAPSMVEQFQESAERVVSQAKAEIEAFTNHAVMQAGLERIAEHKQVESLPPRIDENGIPWRGRELDDLAPGKQR